MLIFTELRNNIKYLKIVSQVLVGTKKYAYFSDRNNNFIIKDYMFHQNENNMNTKEKIKKFFLLAQELQELATEGEDNFFELVKEAESEMDPEEEFLLEDVVRFSSDLQDAIACGYTNLIDYMDD